MMSCDVRGLCVTVLLGAIAGGCASSPVSPFDQVEKSNLLVFRLQNYEPPAPAAPAAGQTAAPILQGLPPEIQNWIQQGAQGLQQLIPPGLLGNLAPSAAAQPAPPPIDTAPHSR